MNKDLIEQTKTLNIAFKKINLWKPKFVTFVKLKKLYFLEFKSKKVKFGYLYVNLVAKNLKNQEIINMVALGKEIDIDIKIYDY